MKEKNLIKKLNINSIQDLREYVLNAWLEMAESEKPEIRILALKEMSRYLFNTSGTCIILGTDLKDKTNIYSVDEFLKS